MFSNSDKHASPRERLVAILGEANTQAAIAGFIAALSRPDVPSLAKVVALSVQHQHCQWWRVLTAGLVLTREATQALPPSAMIS